MKYKNINTKCPTKYYKKIVMAKTLIYYQSKPSIRGLAYTVILNLKSAYVHNSTH